MILGIYGASGLGAEFRELALTINAEKKKWDKILYIDDNPEKEGTLFSEEEIISYLSLRKYPKDTVEIIIAIGEPAIKDMIFNKVKADGYSITNLIYPNTRIMTGAELGEGIVVQDGNAIPPLSKIGNNVLIQGKTVMGHGVVLGDNVVISSMTFVGGDTVIGRNTYIAPSSCLRNGLHIGENAIIGMGSVVTKDIPDNAVAYGNPCKVARINESGRVFKK